MCWECGANKEIYYYAYDWDGFTICDQWCYECYLANTEED